MQDERGERGGHAGREQAATARRQSERAGQVRLRSRHQRLTVTARPSRPVGGRLRAGTGTLATMSATTADVVRRAIWASADEQQPVGEHRRRRAPAGRRGHVVAVVEGRGRPAGPQQVQGRPRRGAEPEVRVVAGGGDEVDGVAADAVGDVHRAHGADQLGDLDARPRPARGRRAASAAVRVEHRRARRRSRVAHRDPRGEPVALRLGQRVGALHLDRVLGRDDHERRRRAW